VPTKSASMKQGQAMTVTAGEFKGRQAIIVDATPFPDTDHARRRKITVRVGNEEIYILPRLLTESLLAPVQVPLTLVPTAAPQSIIDETRYITDLDDPRLDAYRPDASVVNDYVSRKIPNGQTDIDFLLDYHERRQNVLLVGETQAGKTMLVNVLAVKAAIRMGLSKPLPVFTLSGSSGVTDFELFGQTTAWTDPITGVERLVWLPGVVDLACRVGGLLYLDEVNMMAERVTSSLHPVCDYRRMFVNNRRAIKVPNDGFMPEVVKASDDLWIVGTMNPAGYRGAGALNEAFTNRFAWLPWNYDEDVEAQLIPSPTVRLLGQAMRLARSERAITTPVGTAALQRLCDDAVRFGVDTALWSFYAMFQPNEKGKVEAIVKDRSFDVGFRDEVADIVRKLQDAEAAAAAQVTP
jgi:MoxR-like ATPase